MQNVYKIISFRLITQCPIRRLPQTLGRGHHYRHAHSKRPGGNRSVRHDGRSYDIPGHHADGLCQQRDLQSVFQDVPRYHHLWGQCVQWSLGRVLR